MSRLVILGAGGHGRVVADAAELQGLWSNIVYLDDGYPLSNTNYPWQVVGKLEDFSLFIDKKTFFIVAIGNASVRLKWLKKLQNNHAQIATVIHPSAIISRHSNIDKGVVVFANAVVNIGSHIGFGCIINTGAGIDHDVTLKEGVHICPGVHIAGGVTVGERTWIGIGTSVKQMITIGADVLIGAGAAVVSDIENNMQVVGVPAKSRL